jgi:transcriptional regulator with XRE-family HTH domain
MTAGEAIRHIRKRLRKNQVEFGQVLGCQHHTVSRYETGILAPSPLVLVRLMDLAEPEEKAALVAQMQDYSRRGLIGPSVEEFTDGVKPLIDELLIANGLMDLLPPSKRYDVGFRQFVPSVAHIIASCPTVDASIPEILKLWAAHNQKPQVVGWLRDVLGFLRKMLWGNTGALE